MLVDFARLKRLSSTNFSWENNLPTFQLNAAVIIKAKVKRYIQTNIAIYSHVLLRIHVIGGQRSVRIAPPSRLMHRLSWDCIACTWNTWQHMCILSWQLAKQTQVSLLYLFSFLKLLPESFDLTSPLPSLTRVVCFCWLDLQNHIVLSCSMIWQLVL